MRQTVQRVPVLPGDTPCKDATTRFHLFSYVFFLLTQESSPGKQAKVCRDDAQAVLAAVTQRHKQQLEVRQTDATCEGGTRSEDEG